MTMYKQLTILFLHLTFIKAYSFPCPQKCECAVRNVDCSEQNLTLIPEDINYVAKSLNLEKNCLTTLQLGSFSRLQILRQLNLGFNFLEKINENDFDGLLSVRSIDLSFNALKTIHKNAFRELKKLQDLSLQGNMLTNIDGVFTDLTLLNRIDLAQNNLETITIESFRNVTSLRYLILRENQIKSVEVEAFIDNRLLSLISLANNPVGNIDGLFSKNDFLSYVQVTNCSLRTFPKGLPLATRFLYLDQNRISSITRKEIELVENMVKLHISENNLTFIEKDTFAGLEHLEELWLSFNSLKEIPLLPVSCKILHLDENEISSISKDDFVKGSLLEELSIKSNQLSTTNLDTFEHLTSLKKLYLGGNEFSTIQDFAFKPLIMLTELGLTGMELNSIRENAFSGLNNLEKLSMSFMTIDEKDIPENLFKPLKSLKQLDLQESPEIANKLLNTLQMLQSLFTVEEMDLKNNDIETLNANIMNIMPRLNMIYLEGNTFHCDTRLLWLWKWIEMEEYKFPNAEFLECDSPPQLAGNLLLEMKRDQFVPTTLKPVVLSTKGQIFVPTTKSPNVVLNSSKFQNETGFENLNTSADNSYKTTVSQETTMNFIQNVNDRAKLDKVGNHKEYEDSINKILIITVVATIAVVLFAVVVTVVSCLRCGRKDKEETFNQMETFQDNDVTFYVISDEAPPLPPPNAKTRDRGSVSSTRDITDDKFFTIENDSS